jgi:proteasome lid subunit RPN8/RPN11
VRFSRARGRAILVSGHDGGQIRTHARSAEPGWEIGGALLVGDNDRVRRYHPLPNRADRPRAFVLRSSWRREPDERSIVLHSHPTAEAWPSQGDLRWAASKPLFRTFAIYSVRRDELLVWRLFGERGYESVAIEVESGHTASRLDAPPILGACHLTGVRYDSSGSSSNRRITPPIASGA